MNESYLYWVALGLEDMWLLGIFAYQDAPTHRNDDDGDDVDVDDFYGHLSSLIGTVHQAFPEQLTSSILPASSNSQPCDDKRSDTSE